MIKPILMLSGIVFPILYFIQKSKFKKLKNDYYRVNYDFEKLKSSLNDYKNEVLNEVKRYTTPTITADFDIPVYKEKKENSNPDFNPLNIENYKSKKIEKEFLYPIKGLENNGNYFYGKKVVISGDFEKFPNRNDIAKLLWEVGADVDTAIGKNTNILLVGNNAGDVKIEYAEENEIEIMYEENFLEEFNNI